AAAMDVPPLMLPWASSSGMSSLTPIHSSNKPPTTFRNGMASRVSAKAMSTTRRMMAPAVPHRMPCMRCLGARLRQASAMTTALSPPSRMSIRMIWNTAAQLSVWKNSSTLDPQGIFERRNGAGRAPARAARARGTMAARCTAYYCSSALRQYFLTCQENFPQRQHHDRAERSRNKGQLVLCQAQRGIDAHHRFVQGGIADQQFARDKAQQRRADPHDDRETLDDLRQQRTAEKYQGNADRQSNDQQSRVAHGRGGHRHDIVQAHDQVGDHDGANGGQQAAVLLAFAFILAFGHEQRNANVDQQQRADQLEPWQQ